jgi:hypothetical protein
MQKKRIILSPNLGFPKVINFNAEESTFQFELLLLTEVEDKSNITDQFLKSIVLIPIFHYGWMINRLIKKRGISNIVKDLWRRIKKVFLRTKENGLYKILITEYDKLGNEQKYEKRFSKSDLRKLEEREFRAKPIIPNMISLDVISTIQISNRAFLNAQHISPQKHIFNAFPNFKTKNFYKITLKVILTEEIKDFLQSHNFILFDILYQDHEDKTCINYHSIVISKNDWNSMNIIQATDLHLAKRNDEMSEKIVQAYKQNQIESQSNTLEKFKDSLKKRIVNPNNLFRLFIKKMNTKVFENKLDFIFITGDIVDFTVRAEYSSDEENIFDYHKSNWEIFKEILLNINQKSEGLTYKSEELLCPIITIPGNHDYKPWHYDLNWAGIYKKVGLTKSEAKALKGQYPASPIKAILKTKDSLNEYFKHINSFLNFSLTLGNFLFIFINSGSDSYREITDYISGSPSLTGITEKQILFIKNLVNNPEYKNHQVILSIHGPPINTPRKRGIISRFKKIFNKDIITNIDEFKESRITKVKKNVDEARIDDKFNIKYGTVSKNWEKLIKICLTDCILTISGHTHMLNEYRLQKVENINNLEEEDKQSSPAVFYDDYSEICNNHVKIKKMRPFIVQTPALGFKSYKKRGRMGGFREIKIKRNELDSFKVKYV